MGYIFGYPAHMKSKIVSAKEFRRDIFNSLDDIAENFTPYILTKNGEPRAIVMNIEELEALMETYDVLADPELLAQIHAYQKKPVRLSWNKVKKDLT